MFSYGNALKRRPSYAVSQKLPVGAPALRRKDYE